MNIDRRKIVLITGATGMCGRYISRCFQDKQDRYLVYTTGRESLEYERHICHDLEQPIPMDVFPEKVDYFIHCAAVVDETNWDYSLIDTNVKITYNTINYAQKVQASCFIQFSSAAIYDQRGNRILTEKNSVLRPVSSYGVSKAMIETLCTSLLKSPIRLFNLRLGYVLAPKLKQQSFLFRLAKKFEQNEPIEMINPDSRRFNFVDIADITLVCQHLFEYSVSEDFIVVGDEHPTVRQVVKALKNYFPDTKSQVTEVEIPNELHASRLSNEKIKRILNIERFILFEQSLQQIMAEFNTNHQCIETGNKE